jgi:hypothetical protein
MDRVGWLLVILAPIVFALLAVIAVVKFTVAMVKLLFGLALGVALVLGALLRPRPSLRI